MKKITLLPALLLCVFISNYTSASFTAKQTITDTTVTQQPVLPGDFADPTILRVGNHYYATGTSSEWAPYYPLFTSTDMLHWQQLGYVFPQLPAWASSSFWAPELFYHNNTYYVYYVARKKADGISCIGVATSTNPEKGFTDHGIVLEFGKEVIDPFITEDNGKLYMSFKAYGLEGRPIEILCYQLTADGLKVQGEPFSLLRDDERVGLEGQCLIKRNNYYYLFFSAGGCCGRDCSYHVNVARATTLQGPYIKFENNPVLTEGDEWKCTGHGTVVTSADGKDYYLYHAYNKHDNVYTGRQGMLAAITWNSQSKWPSFKAISGLPVTGFRDDFTEHKLLNNWQWDFRHSQPTAQIQNGVLQLSGSKTGDNNTGTALTVRPAKGNYIITTEVANSNAALKGLVIYGDANASVGIGIKSDSVIAWCVKDNERKILQSAVIKKQQPLYVKMQVKDGYQCRFFYGYNADSWQEIKTDSTYFNADYLPPWDRSARPGIMQYGAMNEPATFNFFALQYQ